MSLGHCWCRVSVEFRALWVGGLGCGGPGAEYRLRREEVSGLRRFRVQGFRTEVFRVSGERA